MPYTAAAYGLCLAACKHPSHDPGLLHLLPAPQATRPAWSTCRDTTTITFRPLPKETVDQVLAEGECLSCAGALQVEHALVAPHVERLEGSLDSVMGLSKQQVMQLLLQAAGQL